jgi:hypothetical protein
MRNALLIGGLVVAALVVGLYFALRNDDSAAAQTSTPSEGSAVVVGTPPGAPTVQPGLPGESPRLPQPGPGENPRDYVVGDVRIRDHRTGDNKPIDVPPNAHPADSRKIPPTLTHEISQKVKAVMMQCVADLPKDARGDKPRLEGQIIIAIKNNKASITSSTIQLRNVTGDALESTKQCIESKAVGIENPAPDQADLDNYPIHLSYAIP